MHKGVLAQQMEDLQALNNNIDRRIDNVNVFVAYPIEMQKEKLLDNRLAFLVINLDSRLE